MISSSFTPIKISEWSERDPQRKGHSSFTVAYYYNLLIISYHISPSSTNSVLTTLSVCTFLFIPYPSRYPFISFIYLLRRIGKSDTYL
ncbi:hypothetical protein RIF29_16178 [Crotalaria pallida]|uniref:Uncharacterized protein n=1 Tax=Crotalaria pallida TaxID=3830 RepID=A0AAN9FIE0_CROPI